MRHSRKTVRKALSDPLPPVLHQGSACALSRCWVSVKGIIDKWIEEDEDRSEGSSGILLTGLI